MRSKSISVKTGIRAGGIRTNHNRGVFKVRSGVRAGGIRTNHSRNALAL